MKMFKGMFSYTEMGKVFDYISKVALDLIKARRQGGHTEKVMHTYVHHTRHVYIKRATLSDIYNIIL